MQETEAPKAVESVEPAQAPKKRRAPRRSFRPYKALQIPHARAHTRPPERCRDTSLIQGMVPRPIMEAARDYLAKDNLAWAHILRWSLLEYVYLHNPELSEEMAATYY